MRVKLTGRGPTFRQHSERNSYVLLGLTTLIVVTILLYKGIQQKEIISPFESTLTPTRTTRSFSMEAETYFLAGNLPKSIAAYQESVNQDPKNAELWAEFARVQTYSSALLTTDDARKTRLQEALVSINKAVELAPDDSTVHAIRAFVLDWNANPVLAGAQSATLLTEAEQESQQALQLDNQNTLALAYYAEILNDQMKWNQAQQYIQQALQRDPSLMDVHRVNAAILETMADYPGAIQEYEKAVAITPNLTFLYINIGANYRTMAMKQDNKTLYESALTYFTKAVQINVQIGVSDPIPYLSIGKTYSQMGEFFAAALNVRKAIEINPNNPDVYGSLGIIYFKARNYESAIPALQCAVTGCDAKQSCDVRRCDSETDTPIVIQGLPLTQNTVVYYYTYASVLAGMYRPGLDYCTRAEEIMVQIREKFSTDTIIMGIINPSERICSSLAGSQPQITLESTLSPDKTTTITPTPRVQLTAPINTGTPQYFLSPTGTSPSGYSNP